MGRFLCPRLFWCRGHTAPREKFCKASCSGANDDRDSFPDLEPAPEIYSLLRRSAWSYWRNTREDRSITALLLALFFELVVIYRFAVSAKRRTAENAQEGPIEADEPEPDESFAAPLVELESEPRVVSEDSKQADPEPEETRSSERRFVPILEGVDIESVIPPAEEESVEDDREEIVTELEEEPSREEPLEVELLLEPEIADTAVEQTAGKKEEPVSTTSTANKSVIYSVPSEGILHDYPDGQYWKIDDETRDAAEVLKQTLEEFNIQAEVTGIRKGPVITMFEILPAPGVKLSKIVNLADNIALRLAASRVRIVAPIPGKHAVGIEVPNKHRAIVSFKEMIQDDVFIDEKMEIPVVLGKDITGEAQIVDLTHTPHLLIAGATGSGKSVCVNSIISSVLYRRKPTEVRLLLIDPKIVELKLYNDIPHLLTPVITEPKKAYQALQYCIYEMERRYSLLDALGVRDIRSYNKKIKTKKLTTLPLPYIVIIVDEFADLMATIGKDLESTLARLAAMSRAVGIHLVLATQRPSVDIITGLIKANIPSRIAFMVASKFDSRIL